MLVKIPKLLSDEQVRAIRGALDAPEAPWVDGRATAGHQGARVKYNRQIAEDSPLAAQHRRCDPRCPRTASAVHQRRAAAARLSAAFQPL